MSDLTPAYGSLTRRIKANWQILMLAALGFAPMVGLFFVMSWGRPSYQFFPMAIIAAAMLAWRALETPITTEASGSLKVSRWLGLTTMALFLAACFLWSPWLGYAAFLAGVVAAVWSLGGLALLKRLGPAIIMLLTILPPPLNGDQTLTVWLRHIAVSTSSALLDWLQVIHAQDGNTLLLPGKTLLVEEACSGINSFILCNAFCLFWGLWQNRPLLWWLLAMLATSCFVVLGNILRITIGAAAYYYRHVDLLSGWKHETLGLVLLLGYAGLILSWDQLLVFLTDSGQRSDQVPPDKAAAAPPEVAPEAAPADAATPLTPVLGFKFLGLALAVVGLGSFAIHGVMAGRHGVAALPSLKTVRQLDFSMPATFAGWQRNNADTGDAAWVQTLGVRSSDWSFRHDNISATVAVDYPLDGFHNVKNCYTGNGWQVLGETELLNPADKTDLHAIRLDLQKSIQYALVLHSVVDAHGNWLSAPLNVSSRFSETLGPPQTGYRVQLIVTGYAPPSAKTQADCIEFFLQARKFLVQQLLEQLQKSPAQ